MAEQKGKKVMNSTNKFIAKILHNHNDSNFAY